MLSLRGESGSVMAEYGLVLALLSFAFMSGLFLVESTAASSLSFVQNELLDYGLRDGK